MVSTNEMNYTVVEDMAWAQLQYSRREINEAGAYLIRSQPRPITREYARALVHAFPLNTLQINLRGHAESIYRQSIIAQRLKRLSSIRMKLIRFPTMELWDMQDIGGCRAVVNSVNDVQRLTDTYKSKSTRIRHKLVHEDDYIQQPRDSGYRSRHLIYRYFSDRNEVYNGFKIEIQIRSPLQHAWATAVETVDAFTKQALKSSRGERDWERFFQLMGTEMAFREGTPAVSGTPTDREVLLRELRQYTEELRVTILLRGFTTALRLTRHPKMRGAHYFLLSLNSVTERLVITGYNRRELDRASADYAKKEKQIRRKTGADAVLVSAGSISDLKRAYPNYFADTHMFVEILEESIKA